MLTLNQIVKRLQTLAENHRQLNHFACAHPGEWLTNGDVNYPACFADFSTGEMPKGQTVWNFDLWFVDQSNVAQDSRRNELEVQSDLTLIAQDFKAMLSYTEYGGVDGWEIGDGINLEYFIDTMEDVTISVKMSVKISVAFDNNRCDIPTDGFSFEENNNEYTVNKYKYTGLGTEGNTFSTGLLNKTILLILKGSETPTENPDVDHTPTAKEFRYAPSTGQFLFGSDIEENQIIQILYR